MIFFGYFHTQRIILIHIHFVRLSQILDPQKAPKSQSMQSLSLLRFDILQYLPYETKPFSKIISWRPKRKMMLAKEIERIVSVLLGSAKLESVVWLGYVVWMLKIFDTLIIKGSTYSHKVPRRKTANPKMHQFGSLDPEKAKKTHMTYIWLRLKKTHIFSIYFTFPLRTTFSVAQKWGCEFGVVRTGNGKTRSRVGTPPGLLVINGDSC